MAVGITLLIIGILIEIIGFVPPVKAILKIPIPLTISGSVGVVMIFVGAILLGMGI